MHIPAGSEGPQRVERRYMKHDRVFLIAFSILGRVFGIAAIFAGVIFLISAYAIEENRVQNVVIGLMAFIIGIAFLVTKPFNEEQIARIRRGTGRSGPP